MNLSIRTFLLINLLLSVTLITSLAIVGNLFLAHRDIQTQLDNQLVSMATRIQALFSDGLTNRNLAVIQKNLQEKEVQNKSADSKTQQPAVEFRIWENDKAILSSTAAPNIHFQKIKPGFSSQWVGDEPWRIYTSVDKKNNLAVMVGEQSSYRQQLEDQLTQDSILIMLITYPFLGFLIWIIVGRGLDTLKRVAEEVKHRVPSYLKSVNLESVPSEIEPLVAELNSLFIRLQEAFDREKRFTADAAHELKTPLAALSTQVQVALRAETPEDRRQTLLKVLSGVNRSTHVVQQLLTLSRMDPQANIQHPIPVQLARQAADAAAQLAPEAIAKNIDLELLAPDSKAVILANATTINILIRNLVDNAIRYTQEGGFVKIDINEDDKEVTLIVTDNGPGIPLDLRERVFERFFRIPGTQTTGSGLGLGIVQQIAKLHRATVELATPAHGKGLEVRVSFPK